MIATVRRRKNPPRGIIILPKEYIGKKMIILTQSELTNLYKCYWFLKDLKRRMDKSVFLKG